MKSNTTKINDPDHTYFVMSKTLKVIESCTTLTQLKIARNYLKLALDKLKVKPLSVEENILLNVYMNKSIQLNNPEKK